MIPNHVMYGNSNLGGFNMIKIDDFFQTLKVSWIKCYVNGLNNHCTDIIDENLNFKICLPLHPKKTNRNINHKGMPRYGHKKPMSSSSA